MTFTYTYRDRTGARREEAIEAASRAEVFAALKSQGISPLSVKEGGKVRSRGQTPPHTGGTRSRASSGGGEVVRAGARLSPWLLIAAVVFPIVCITCWWLTKSNVAKPETAEAKGKEPPPSKVEQKSGDKAPSSKEKVVHEEQPLPQPAAKKTPLPRSAKNNEKPPWPPPPVERDENGRVIPPPGAITLDSQKSIFRRSSDSYIAMLISPRPGETLPPMPAPGPRMEEEFRESLKEPIVIGEDDTPEDKATKLAVIAARDEIKKLLDSGVTFADVVKQHESLLKENNEIREKALTEYREILKSGDEKGAERYFKTINIALQQMGVPPMEKSTSHEAVRARMLETRTRKQQEVAK